MTALKVIGIILLVFLLIGFLRAGTMIEFGDGVRVSLRIWPLRKTFSLSGKEKKPKKEKEPKEKKAEQEEPEKEKKGKRELPRITPEDIPDLASAVLPAFGAMVKRACRRMHIDPLEATVVFGGSDPANSAEAFGAANAAMFALMPKLEELFYIPNPSLHLRMDLDAEGTRADGKIGVSYRVWDMMAIVFTLVIPVVKWYLHFRRTHKNDEQAHKGVPAGPETNDTEEQIA